MEAHQAEIRLHHPRIDAGDAHRSSQQVLAQSIVDHPRRGFAGAIHRSIGINEFAGHRPQREHVAAPAHHHPQHHRARHIKQPLHVGVDHFFPVFDSAGVELFHAAAEAGIIHQHIDLRPLLRQFVDCELHGMAIAHVQVNGVHGCRAALESQRSHLSQFAGAPRGQQQTCSLGRKGHGRGRANAGTGPGDEDDFIFQAHVFHILQAAPRRCAMRYWPTAQSSPPRPV